MTTEQINQRHEEDLLRLQNFRLFDDDFMTKVFEGHPECIELVLRIILDKQDLMILDVHTQVFVENILNRSVRFDVLATDTAGTKFNIEVQRTDRGAGKKRARYNSSMIDANYLMKGEDFEALPDTYVIFITEKDVLGKGEPLYSIERYLINCNESFEDGSHIIYVNGSCRDDTPLGKLMHDFSCTRPQDMNYKVLADRSRFFKEEKEGVAIMCKAMEDMRYQALQEGISLGKKEGISLGREEGIESLILDNLEEGKEKEIILSKLVRRFHLDRKQAEEYFQKYAMALK